MPGCARVEDLSRAARFAKSINAGVDQLGGEEDVGTLIEAVESGLVATARIDECVTLILRAKFSLGLFDNPYVVEANAEQLLGSDAFKAAGLEAQKRSVICLKRPRSIDSTSDSLPNTYLDGFDAETSVAGGVTTSAEADVIIARIGTPHQVLHPNHFFGARQQEGEIDYKPDNSDRTRLEALAMLALTIAVVGMSRPAVLADIIDQVDGLFVELGVSDMPLLDVTLGVKMLQASCRLSFPHRWLPYVNNSRI